MSSVHQGLRENCNPSDSRLMIQCNIDVGGLPRHSTLECFQETRKKKWKRKTIKEERRMKADERGRKIKKAVAVTGFFGFRTSDFGFRTSDFGFRMVGEKQPRHAFAPNLQALPKRHRRSLYLSPPRWKEHFRRPSRCTTLSRLYFDPRSVILFTSTQITRIKTTRQRKFALVVLCSTKMSMLW